MDNKELENEFEIKSKGELDNWNDFLKSLNTKDIIYLQNYCENKIKMEKKG